MNFRLESLNRLDFVMGNQCVFYNRITEFLNIVKVWWKRDKIMNGNVTTM
jgi:hypothetical protein